VQSTHTLETPLHDFTTHLWSPHVVVTAAPKLAACKAASIASASDFVSQDTVLGGLVKEDCTVMSTLRVSYNKREVANSPDSKLFQPAQLPRRFVGVLIATSSSR
jgi:hypothetical protein